MVLAAGCATVRRLQDERPAYRRVAPTIAFEMLRDSGRELMVLDLRERHEFIGARGHVMRAVNIPVVELPWRLAELSSYRNATFLVYCDADECGSTGMAILVSSGFQSPILMEGGIDAWSSAGYGTVAGAPPAVALGPSPPQSASAPSEVAGEAYLRLLDGSIVLAPRRPSGGWYLPGRIENGKFSARAGIAGAGQFCADLYAQDRVEAGGGWLELDHGAIYTDQPAPDPSAAGAGAAREAPPAPRRPYVRGCVRADGGFYPESRQVIE